MVGEVGRIIGLKMRRKPSIWFCQKMRSNISWKWKGHGVIDRRLRCQDFVRLTDGEATRLCLSTRFVILWNNVVVPTVMCVEKSGTALFVSFFHAHSKSGSHGKPLSHIFGTLHIHRCRIELIRNWSSADIAMVAASACIICFDNHVLIGWPWHATTPKYNMNVD